MSTVSLNEFLKPISQALGRTEPPAFVEPCEATKAPLPGDFRDYSTDELAQRFMEEASKMGTIVRESAPEKRSVKAVISCTPMFRKSTLITFPKP